MIRTRADGVEALSLIITNVFRLDNGSPLVAALTKEFLLDIRDIFYMPFKDIDKLKYDNAQGNEVHLDRLHTYPLRILKFYLYHGVTESMISFGDAVQSFSAQAYDDF